MFRDVVPSRSQRVQSLPEKYNVKALREYANGIYFRRDNTTTMVEALKTCHKKRTKGRQGAAPTTAAKLENHADKIEALQKMLSAFLSAKPPCRSPVGRPAKRINALWKLTVGEYDQLEIEVSYQLKVSQARVFAMGRSVQGMARRMQVWLVDHTIDLDIRAAMFSICFN